MKLKLVLFLVVFVGSLLLAPVASATTYYISAAGHDSAPGTTVASAWRSIERVNAAQFQPGDKIMFEGGTTFVGSIWLQSRGTAARPIVFSSYGPAAATISSGNNYGFWAPNTGGVELRRLRFVGSGRLTTNNSGVIFTTDLANERLEHLVLDSLEVSGYLKSGIVLGSASAGSGYDGVRINSCQVHDNGEAGLSSYSFYPQLSHRNWVVTNCEAYNNAGRQDVTTTHTGNGIVLAGIDGALVEHCEAYNNGWLNSNPGGGPVGIWGWLCNNLVIQDCESHHNRSGLAHDGGGFDLDGGCTNSVLQYNYSHDNDGAGYLLAQFDGAPPMHDLTIRYNISENDARRYGQGAIMLWSSGANGGIQRASIHNNTVYLTPATDGTEAKAFYVSSHGVSQIEVRNNIFQTTSELPQVSVVPTGDVRLQGNCYWGSGVPLQIRWGGATYTELAAWRTATQQEMLGSRVAGLAQNPAFVSPGGGGTMDSKVSSRLQPSWNAYKLQTTSALIGQGLNLATEFGLQPGDRDFFGVRTPAAAGAAGNPGAAEKEATPLPVVLVSFTAERRAGSAVLRWATATETQNAYFEIQSSSDGHAFQTVGRVQGRGTTTQQTAYSWSESLGRYQVPVVYYRLKQVDANGETTYSSVLTLAVLSTPASGLAMQAWPNPTQGEVSLQLYCPEAGAVTLLCTDALGHTHLVRRLQLAKGASSVVLPEVSQLPQGLYVLSMQQGSQRIVTKLLRH
ncbi:right-handed parallel beta-helix repeat-containing protein [Hymenobacter endophyticus]|uniref:Right-handed parallel beta-helix repeat-containing protein n=1 Tax=Hymenobacter endophyticus TaxID=3076335 RepID=A0ABU3TCU7_9BACT|nr:right-handed parallel beta-helix repeat-containing protein [Hymenobacter endophyticus]MDU0369196.1 right-handed parallel beta-helix repeat-containing protein [Hymenobacter endophyticus]